MTQEEKAKAYDNVREKIVVRFGSNVANEIFSEYEESEDERIRKDLILYLKSVLSNKKYGDKFIESWIAWLEKQGEQPKKHDVCDYCDQQGSCVSPCPMKLVEKQAEQKTAENKGMNLVEEEMTPFQKKVFCIIDTTIEKEQGLKQVCDELLRLAHDEIMQESFWSEEDESRMDNLCHFLEEYGNQYYGHLTLQGTISWLKSLRPQSQWKPSDEQINTLEYYMQALICNKHKEILFGLYTDLKKLREK